VNRTVSGSERRVIQVAWWIGLLGALLATLVVLKQVALVLRALRDIHELAVMTRDAANGIARNVAPIGGLGAVGTPAQELDRQTRTLAATAAAIEAKLGSLVPLRERS
jgi:hypothetical protein